ncbi:MAG: helix-turn-helix domain-containing protein [Eubacterium sp.]|nr:helix-turn-helix domain-containing protein [Eubacterium sp.]
MGNTEELYVVIADNIRKERKRRYFSQGELAERADISVDTVKSVENGRRAMSLDTYLKIVQALGTTPVALMNKENPERYTDRFAYMIKNCSRNEVEFILYMVEQIVKGQACYLK